MSSPSTSHCWGWIVSALTATIAFVLCQAFSFLSMTSNEIFISSTGNISDVYTTEITPTGWTFAIWGIIYIFQALWIIHVLISIFRTNNGGPLYNNPTVVSILFLVVYALNMGLNISWLLVWDRTLFELALGILILITLTLYICLVDYYIRVNRNVKVLAKDHKVYLFLFRLFLQNGVSIYATWVTIATLLNLTIVLVYSVGLSQTTACIIALSVLAAELLVFALLDMCVFERYLRYTFSTYLTVLWALTGSLVGNWDPSKPHSIMTVVLLGVAFVLLLAKIIITIVNSQKRPLYVNDVMPTKEPQSSA